MKSIHWKEISLKHHKLTKCVKYLNVHGVWDMVMLFCFSHICTGLYNHVGHTSNRTSPLSCYNIRKKTFCSFTLQNMSWPPSAMSLVKVMNYNKTMKSVQVFILILTLMFSNTVDELSSFVDLSFRRFVVSMSCLSISCTFRWVVIRWPVRNRYNLWAELYWIIRYLVPDLPIILKINQNH